MLNCRNFQIAVANFLVVVGLLISCAPCAAINCTLKANQGVGVGFGMLSKTAQTLTINLNAPAGWEIATSDPRDNSGVHLWSPDGGIDTVSPTHTYNVVGVIPEEGHSAGFLGTLTTASSGGAGSAGSPPTFDAAVADIDIDFTGVDDATEADEPAGGKLFWVLHDGEFPSSPPGNCVNLRVVVRTKWQGPPQSPPSVGDISFQIEGTGAKGVAIYEPGGTLLTYHTLEGTLVTGTKPIPSGTYDQTFKVLTNSKFVGAAIITATFTWKTELAGSTSDKYTKDKARMKDGKVNLIIHNGLKNESGGQEISGDDDEEYSKGAFTVANLNDTDGDNNPDWDDNEVASVKRDEVDLMELTVTQPNPNEGGNVTLSVKTGNVKLWKFPTKKEEFELTDNKATIATDQLPITLWVEARDVSAALRDIELELEYKGAKDNVRATAIWAEKTGFRNSPEDQHIKELTANAASGQKKINVTNTDNLAVGSKLIIFRGSTNIRETRIIHSIDDNEITFTQNLTNAYQTEDEVLEGVSPLADAETASLLESGGPRLGATHVSPRPSNGMEMEFTVKPAGIGSEEGIVWDVTRQIETKSWQQEDGEINQIDIHTEDFPSAPEQPNDDGNLAGNDDDESIAPREDKMYSIDGTGPLVPDVAFTQRWWLRMNMREFVRIKFSGSFNDVTDEVEGSRTSDLIQWRSRHDLVRVGLNWTRNMDGGNVIELVEGVFQDLTVPDPKM